MQRVIEEVLNENKITYILYDKGLSTKSQQKKFRGLCEKKSKQVFVVERKPKNELFLENIQEEQGLGDMESIKLAVFRNDTVYLVPEDVEEEELREDIYDNVVNCGEIYTCDSCSDIIRTQKMRCESCKESYLCTFCFAKSIIVSENSTKKCSQCENPFLSLQTKMFLDEMVELYKSNPRDLFTLIQKKKKELPPGLKNLTKIIQSAQEQAKARGEKLNIGS